MKNIQYICKNISIHDSRIIESLRVFNSIEIYEIGPAKTIQKKGKADQALISSLSLDLETLWLTEFKQISFLSMGYELNEEINDLARKKIIERNLELADLIVIDNPIHERILRQILDYNGDIYYLPYGCDIEVFGSIKSNNNRSIGINRPFSPHYNNQLVIQAVTRLSPQDYDEFVIVDYGDEEFYSKFRLALEKTKLRKVKGREPESIRRFLEMTNIYVSASESDGSSVSMLEAMAAGKLCIVSDHPCNAYWIENGKNGFVFKSQDEEDLYLTLSKALNLSIGSSNEITEAARARVRSEANWRLNSSKFAHFLASY